MKRSFIFAPGMLALSVSAISNAHTYDHLYVFGDSLSDGGNGGRYTINGTTSKLYNDLIAQHLGTKLTNSDSGGNNYAVGGATAVPNSGNKNNTTQEQVGRYLASHGDRADPNGMYVHWVGGNDIQAALRDPGNAQKMIEDSAKAAASQVHMLLDKGAGLVIVPTVPDVGMTPKILELVIGTRATSKQMDEIHAILNGYTTIDRDTRLKIIDGVFKKMESVVSKDDAKKAEDSYKQLSSNASALVDSYNKLEDIVLSQKGGNIVRVDVNALLHEVIDNPLRYGFSNTVGYACARGIEANSCSSDDTGFDASKPFLFADDFHPTPAAQRMIGEQTISILNAPHQVMSLTNTNNVPVKGALASLDGRLQQLRSVGNEQSKIGVFGGYSGNHNSTLTLGSDYQLTDNILLGGMISRYQDKRSVNHFRADGRGYLFTTYGLWRYYDKGWISGDLHYLDMKYEDITRGIVLNEWLRKEHASTTGHQWGGRITAGWDIPLTSTVMTSPIIQYAWDKSYVKGYRESGNSSTAMHFGDQRYDSQVGTLGWRFDTNFSRFNPYAEVRFNHQFGDKHYQISSAINLTETSFVSKSQKQDTNWREYVIGMNAAITKDWGAFASISRNDGDVQNHTYAFSLGVNASF
ncbi:autotransporter outer membrane beta-barrel domain-containing protein [Photorhabdus bodei]|uniref:Autotransporter domain-containing esterase n=1 Tax=Photorhabdus bodei TaxID=2029681 RepID=A0A329XBA4_9GAMM|nr:autotransporter domain-containing protein [Photorhabdus bodei]NDK98606.1 autotransporter domain-containing protein [Photorhabdus bodei]NDL02859.1 autotransporter domain-containing protein [Photorhabdus bodei]NDL07064.1 autotransporter domain-containing protein [Photorhabdus bodei]RAX13785.1 autotransporter domain-containing esterase [Photorhabdus bodei]